MTGWIEWRGGECPVSDDVEVSVMFRRGNISTPLKAEMWSWSHHGGNGDIVAYRLVEEPA
jgi:hypothetical protein